VEELLFGHLTAFGMVGDEHQLDVAVLRRHKLIE
jgi:hypothetical protein